MKKYLISAIVILAVLAVGVLYFYRPAPDSVESVTPSATTTQQTQSSDAEYGYVEQYKTASKIFSCRVRRYTESGCELFVSDSSGGNLKDLGLAVDYGDFSTKIQASPDGKTLLIVHEHEAMVLDTTTLAQKVVVQAPAGEALGTYDAFPAFIPYAKWLSNTQIQVSIFKQDTPEPYDNDPAAVPLETRTISIN